jgi:hypothetical protein
MITLEWGSLVVGLISFLTLISTLIATWRSIARLKKDVVASLQALVCSEIEKKIEPFAHNQLDVLRCSIVRAHNQYKKDGSISRYVLQSIEDLFRDYKNASGNGFVDSLMAELRELPDYSDTRKQYNDKERG